MSEVKFVGGPLDDKTRDVRADVIGHDLVVPWVPSSAQWEKLPGWTMPGPKVVSARYQFDNVAYEYRFVGVDPLLVADGSGEDNEPDDEEEAGDGDSGEAGEDSESGNGDKKPRGRRRAAK